MTKQPHIREALIREIARYLAAVDLFRAERCEPTWLPELALSGVPLATSVTDASGLARPDARLN